jgi:hypothetical protein
MSADPDLFGEPGPRRRFRRGRSTGAEDDAAEAISALHAEMLLLREEN